jgi:pimeloyl-ACP methyl ester carboxylesterase
MATQSRQHESAGSTDPRTVTADDGTAIAYETYGPSDGTPLVFLHGTPGSRLLGGVFEDHAHDAGVRVIAPDRSGYGRSGVPDEFSLERGASALESLLDALCVERAPVVAFSGGAPHALATAVSMPARITGVELVSGAVPPQYGTRPAPMHRVLGTLAKWAPSVAGGGYRLSAMLARRRSPTAVADLYTAPESPVAVPEPIARLVGQDFCAGLDSTTAGAVHDSQYFTAPWHLSVDAIDGPVRFWHGTADSLAPFEDVRAFSEVHPHVTVEPLEDHGHLGTLLASREPILECCSGTSVRAQDSP